MCISAGTAALLSFAGTAVSAVGQWQAQRAAAQAAREQAMYHSQVARNNAIIAQQNAADVRDRGARAEDEQRRRIHQTKGSAKAAQAAGGFLVDDTADSTNVQMVADLAEAGELDILTIRDNTEREAHRAEVQGQQFVAEAGLFDLKAASSTGPSGVGALGTLLGGAASAYKIYKA